MRHREEIEVFSLSFLDLIFCTMAGVLVLYITAERSQSEKPKKIPARIQITFEKELGDALVLVCLKDGSEKKEGTNMEPNVWAFSGQEFSIILKKGFKKNASLVLCVQDLGWQSEFANRKSGSEMSIYKARVKIVNPQKGMSNASGGSETVSLEPSNGYFKFWEIQGG